MVWYVDSFLDTVNVALRHEYDTGNTRVISQKALDHFRTNLAAKQHDPYSVLLRRNKLPMALLDDASNPNLRKVRIWLTIASHLLTLRLVYYSAHILSKLSRFRKRLDLKRNGRGPGWMLVPLRSSAN